MATCSDIVRLAMARLGQLRSGETPTGQEADDGMLALQSLYDGWVGSGLFGRLNDVIVTGNYTAIEQDRVINDINATITLPITITPQTFADTTWLWPDQRTWADLATEVSRPPLDLAMIEVIGAGNVIIPVGLSYVAAPGSLSFHRYLFDRMKRSWVQMNGLTLTTEAPLSDRGTSGLASCLAMSIADMYGEQISPTTAMQASLFKWGLSAKYDSARVAGRAEYY